MSPDEINARLLYRDGLILVLDKPAGIPVHRGPKGGESLVYFGGGFGALTDGIRAALEKAGVTIKTSTSVLSPI